MRIIEITKGDITRVAEMERWTDHAIDSVSAIVNTWLDSDLARSIMLFFKEDSIEDLHAYLPLVPIDERERPKPRMLKGAPGRPSILGVGPFPIRGTTLSSSDVEVISVIMRTEYYWTGNVVFRMSENNQEYEYDTEKPVSWELIKYARDLIIDVTAISRRTPAMIVRAVEHMQREYDEASGFAQCQIDSHAFAIKLSETINKGMFIPEDLIRFIQYPFDLFKIANPGAGKKYTMHFAGFVPGSSCVVGDYDILPEEVEKVDRIAVKEKIAKAEERMVKLVKAAPILTTKQGSPAEKVNEFKRTTGLSDEQAYAAMHGLSKLRDSNQTVEFYSNDQVGSKGEKASVKINSSARTQLAKNKVYLAAIIEPDKARDLVGKIVELDHYHDDDLKFGVYVEDERATYAIHYLPSEDKNIKEHKGEVVSIRVLREGPHKPWHFQEWLR